MSTSQDLNNISRSLSEAAERLNDTEFTKPLDDLAHAANEFGKAWSGSWLGYHSNVYYIDFSLPPPGARFSQEWGFEECWPIEATVGDWREYRATDVVEAIGQAAGEPDTSSQQTEAKKAAELFDDAKSQVLSLLSTAISGRSDDKFLADLQTQTEKLNIFDAATMVRALSPKGQLMTRDMSALEKGLVTPPHISVIAKVAALRDPFRACRDLSKIALRIAGHLKNQEKREVRDARIGTNVFIGHGRSTAWRDLKDFIQDRLHLPWDEFNRVPIAGVANIARLSQMLDESAVALLVMTAEDEQSDGRLHARMNVIHEAGLFQGRLGFERAIVLLEEGCEVFSNIQGLGQIRFPKGNIRAIFEEVRQVLEREGLLE